MAQDAWLAVRALGGAVLFVAMVFTVGRRVLAAMARRAEADPGTLRASTGWALMLLMLAAAKGIAYPKFVVLAYPRDPTAAQARREGAGTAGKPCAAGILAALAAEGRVRGR